MTADHESSRNEVRAVARSIGEKDYTAFLEETAARLKFQVEFAQSMLRNLLLVNGGAILALLTVLGNSSMHPNGRGMWWSFLWFGLGLVADLGAYFAAFYSQLFFYNGTLYQAWNAQLVAHELEETNDPLPEFKKGDIALRLGVLAALSSLLPFIIGAFVALDALIK